MTNAIQKLPTYIQEKISTVTIPVKYTAAVKALHECLSIDDAKYFADKSEALAAWAKIYKNDQAAVEAKRLKLHAFRRMGVLARQLRPHSPSKNKPGPSRLLQDSGLSQTQAETAVVISKMPKKSFRVAVESPTPRAPSHYRNLQRNATHSYGLIMGGYGYSGGQMARLWSWVKRYDPKETAQGLTKSEARKAKDMTTEIIEWMDTFDQYLRV